MLHGNQRLLNLLTSTCYLLTLKSVFNDRKQDAAMYASAKAWLVSFGTCSPDMQHCG